MRANTKKKHKMGRRFAIVIGVAAAGVIALGAQTAAAAPAVVKYDSKLTITHEAVFHGTALWHGGLGSEVRKCVEGRRVFLFQERRGRDRKLGSARIKKNDPSPDPADLDQWFQWWLRAPVDGRVYVKVMPKVRDGFVCRADRSLTDKDVEAAR